jgi:ubiquinone/menaquinone biosynthesis C-methylase UbiE
MSELLLGVAGLALLRHMYDGTDEAAAARLADVRRVLEDDAFAAGEPVTEAEPRAGYGLWAERYDEPGNPIVALEEPVVRSFVEALRPGRALDAACGTGRHARYLVDRGHDVVGVDASPEMLRAARASVPGATFREADLRDIPAQAEEFDVAVCGLALAHLDDLDGAVRELARVLKRGGRLVISVLHPFQVQLGWHAPFTDARGNRAFVREHPHTHADYLNAFKAAGLQMLGCAEPKLTSTHVRAKRRAFLHLPDATMQAYAGLPGVLVWDVEKR